MIKHLLLNRVMQTCLCIILIIIFSSELKSAVYYVSSDGSDSNSGTSTATPWQTISKVNSMMNSFTAGDQILFRRGDKFFGELKITKGGTSGNNMVFGSYGTGELAEITGKKVITNWTVHSGNIYKANVYDTVSQIYIGEKIMTIARFPNSGFLKIDAGNGSNGFYDAELTQSNNYWNDANCKVRTINWLYEIKSVSAFSTGNISFSSPSIYPPLANYGYYFDNKLSLLDIQNEWYYDKSAQLLYFYAPGGVNPNTLNVEAVTARNGVYININVANITIQDLKLTGFREVGVDGYTGNNNIVQRCSISKSGKFGVRLNGINNKIYDNILEDNLNVAVCGVFNGGEIKNNFVKRTGLIAGYGDNGYGYYGILLYNASNTIIEKNIIDSSGYVGLTAGSNAIVRNNVISYSLLTLNDGGAIYLNNSDGLQIINNILSNSIGNTTSSGNPASYASGIYVNGINLSNSIIQGNTIYACRSSGIIMDMLSTSTNNIISSNILYNNFDAQIIFSDWSSSVHVPVFNTQLKGNIFCSLQSTQPSMKQIMFNNSSFTRYGYFDSNYYYNPYSEYVINRTMVYGVFSSSNYSLDLWKNIYNDDANSKSSIYSFSQYGVTDTLSNNLILNSRFTENISNWTTWPSGSYISHSVNSLLDTGCMKIRWTGEGNNESFTMSNNMSVTKGNYYQASFSCVGEQNGTFSLWGMSAGYPGFPRFFPKNYFSYSNIRKNYSIVIKADTSDLTAARLSFCLILPDSLFYIDNVNFYRVSVNKIDSTQQSKLFLNETSSIKNISLNGIVYKDLDGIPVTGSISLLPFSSRILINDNTQIYKILNLTALKEGLYNQLSNTTIPDTVKAYLRNASYPYSVIDSAKSLMQNNGTGLFYFKNAVNGNNYYIAVKHRNSVETWSNSLVSFNDYSASYDFSASESAAYGNNLVQMGSRYCIYSGDVNQDGSVDGSDLSIVENDVFYLTSGYIPSDLNGDETADASDLSIVENNVVKSVNAVLP